MTYALLSKPKQAVASAPTTKPPSTDLRIGKANDVFEQDADRTADAVMSGPRNGPLFSLSRMQIAAPLRRECSCGGTCAVCGQRKHRGSATGEGYLEPAPALVHEALRSPGHKLDPALRESMQARFGRDFRDVRVHTDEVAARSAQALSANAYTVGHRIVFNRGKYAPDSQRGRRLLAHELAHVVQQGAMPPAVAQRDTETANDSDGPAGNTPLSQALKAADQRRWEVAARLANDLDAYNLKTFVRTQELLQAPGDPNWIYYLHLGALGAGLGEGSPIAKATEATFLAVKKREDQRSTEQPGARDSQGSGTAANGADNTPPPTVEAKKAQCEAGQPADLKVFPIKLHYNLTWKKFDLTEAPIQAARAGDEILVSQPFNSVRGEAKFRQETNTLPLQTFTGGIRLRPDDVVRVHLYDFNQFKCVTGEDMLKLGHASDMATLSAILQTIGFATNIVAPGAASTAIGVTLGVGAEAANQQSAVDLGLQDEIHWGQIAVNALLQIVLQKFGQQLSEAALSKIAGVAAGTYSRAALEVAVRSVLDGANAAAQTALMAAANLLFDRGANKNKPTTVAEFLADLADQFAQGALLGAIMAVVHQQPGAPGQQTHGGDAHGEAVNSPPDHAEPRPSDVATVTPAESRASSAPASENMDASQTAKAGERAPSATRADVTNSADAYAPTSEPQKPAIGSEDPLTISKDDALAEAPTGDGHEAVVTKDAIAICSPSPCPVVHVEFATELDENPWAKKRYEEIQALRDSDPEQAAKSAARLIKVLGMLQRRRSLPPAAQYVPPSTVTGPEAFGDLSAELNLPATKEDAKPPSQQPVPHGAGAGTSGQDRTPATPQQLQKLLADQRGFSFSEPGAPAVDPAGVGRGVGAAAGGRRAGHAVFAAAQITNKQGEVVDTSVAAYFGGGDKHAEEQALNNLSRAVADGNAEGGELLVVVDQEPCGPGRNDCRTILKDFARDHGLKLTIKLPVRPSMRPRAEPGETVSSRTAQRGSQRTDMPPVELRDFEYEHGE